MGETYDKRCLVVGMWRHADLLLDRQCVRSRRAVDGADLVQVRGVQAGFGQFAGVL